MEAKWCPTSGNMASPTLSENETVTTKTHKTHKAPGTLPNDLWLRANGFEEMADAMKKNPELFAHIEQRDPNKVSKPTKATKLKPKATEAEHITMAKHLAENASFTIQIESASKQSERAVAAGATEGETTTWDVQRFTTIGMRP